VLVPLSNLVQDSEVLKKQFNEIDISTIRHVPTIFQEIVRHHPNLDAIREIKNINEVDCQGHSALHLAVGCNPLTVVKELLEKKANINLQDHEGNTALHYAAGKGKTEIVRELIASKVDHTIRNKNDKTPLSVANDGIIMEEFFNEASGSQYHATINMLILLDSAKDEVEEPLLENQDYDHPYWHEAKQVEKSIQSRKNYERYDLQRFHEEMVSSLTYVLSKTGNPFSSLFTASSHQKREDVEDKITYKKNNEWQIKIVRRRKQPLGN
jgi:hypothetical protein